MIRAFAAWFARAVEISEALSIVQGTPLRKVGRRIQPIEVVLHESCTHSRAGCVKVLQRRKLGVHFTVDRDGSIHQHVPISHSTIHAGGAHNARSISIEVVNRYYGRHALDGQDVIPAVWAHKGLYIVPALAQLESTWKLCQWLDVQFDTLPLAFPCAGPRDFKWGRDEAHALEAGIKAHHRWHHADGLFPEHYCAVRARGFNPTAAFELTLDRAQSGARLTSLPAPKAA